MNCIKDSLDFFSVVKMCQTIIYLSNLIIIIILKDNKFNNFNEILVY